MLPFMQPKKIASIIMEKRSSAGVKTSDAPESQSHPQLLEHAKNLISAVHAKDEQKVADALKGAHEHLSGLNDPGQADNE